jgi:hypothetical protein
VTLSNCTVTIVHTETTDNGLGDTTTETTETELEWALFAPRSSQERVDPRSPAVITAGTIYGPFGASVDADDTLVIAGHSDTVDGAWQVEGMPGQWSLNDWRPGFEVAVTRVG